MAAGTATPTELRYAVVTSALGLGRETLSEDDRVQTRSVTHRLVQPELDGPAIPCTLAADDPASASRSTPS